MLWSKSGKDVRREPLKVKENYLSKAVESNENPLGDDMRGEGLLADGSDSIVAPVKDATVDATLRTVA